MNILELFEKLNLEKGIDYTFSQEEVIKIEKRVNIEKKLNPEIDNNVASNLVLALKNYPEEFNFLVNDFRLYNFFANSRYPRDKFFGKNGNPEKIRYFISQFLEEDLVLYFDKKMAKNAFEDMEYLLQAKEYFPEDVLYKIEKKSNGKIELLLNQLNTLNIYQMNDSLFYLKDRSFFKFLSHFNSPEMDENVTNILNRIVKIYNATKKPGYGESVMYAIANYKAYDPELNALLDNNVKVVQSNYFNESSGSSGMSGRTIFIIIIIVLKLIWAMSKCSSNRF